MTDSRLAAPKQVLPFVKAAGLRVVYLRKLPASRRKRLQLLANRDEVVLMGDSSLLVRIRALLKRH